MFERVTLVGGDFIAEIPVEADLYVLKSVLQHWDDVAARAILESCRDAMPARPGSQSSSACSLKPRPTIRAP